MSDKLGFSGRLARAFLTSEIIIPAFSIQEIISCPAFQDIVTRATV